jgi:hypothetical protein
VRWPFSRRRPAPTVAGTTTRSEPAAWRSLPTIHRAVETIEPSAHSQDFVHDLGTRRPLEHFVQPLGHDVRTEAPGGIATGIAGPAIARNEGPELDYSHPTDRRQAHEVARTGAGGLGSVQRVQEPSEAKGRMPDLAPVRVLRAEQAPAAEAPASESEPEIVPETAAAPEVPTPQETPPAPIVDEAGVAREPASAGQSEESLAPEAPSSAEEGPDEGAPVQRTPETKAPLVGRRLGLGDPIIQRPSTASETPSVSEEGFPLAGRAAASESVSPGPVSAVEPGAGGASEGGIPRAASDSGASAKAGAPASPASLQRTVAGEPAGIAPVAGATPSLVRTRGVMRKESAEEPESVPEPAPALDLPAPRRLTVLPAEPGRAEPGAASGGEATTVHRAAEEYGPEQELPPPAGAAQAQRAPEATGSAPTPERSDAGEARVQEAEIVPEPAALASAQAAASAPERTAAEEMGGESPADGGFQSEVAQVTTVAPLVSARDITRIARAPETPGELVQRAPESHAAKDTGGAALQRATAASSRTASSGVASTASRQPSRTLTSTGEVHRSAVPSAAEGRGSMLAAGLVHAAPMQYVSRAPADEASPETEPEAALPLASRKAAEPPSTTVSTTQWVAPFAHPGEAAVASGVATPDGNGSVVFRTPADHEAPVVQRDDGRNPIGEMVGGMEPGAGQGDLGSTVVALMQKVEFEQLLTKLEDPLYRRLKRRLLLQRERRGKGPDL